MMYHTSRGIVLFLMLTGALSDDCDQEQLIKCAFPLTKFTDKKGFYSSKEELEKMCPQLKGGLQCIDDFTNRCMTAVKRNHFNELHSGTHSVITELCENGSYQEGYCLSCSPAFLQAEFLRHQPCLLGVRSDHEECAHGYQEKIHAAPGMGVVGDAGGKEGGNGEEGGGGSAATVSAEGRAKYLRTVCCSFQVYLQCSKRVVLEKCGNETVKFTERFLDRMAFPLITNHCEDYHVGSDKCRDFLSPPPSSSPPPPSLQYLSSFLLPFLLLRTLFPST